jgi:hypothetical protein
MFLRHTKAAGALAEIGGDVGGANVLKQVNADFCTDYGNPNGLINKANQESKPT